MTAKAAFEPSEWKLGEEGPTSAAMLVIVSQHGGSTCGRAAAPASDPKGIDTDPTGSPGAGSAQRPRPTYARDRGACNPGLSCR
jgi:hypothetical protein